MNRYHIIFLIVLLMGGLLWARAVQPLVIAGVQQVPDTVPQVQVDTLPAGYTDTLHRPLYKEQPLVRPINHTDL